MDMDVDMSDPSDGGSPRSRDGGTTPRKVLFEGDEDDVAEDRTAVAEEGSGLDVEEMLVEEEEVLVEDVEEEDEEDSFAEEMSDKSVETVSKYCF